MRQFITLMFLGILITACSDSKKEDRLQGEIDQLKHEMDSIKNIHDQNKLNRKHQVASFLTFQEGNAEEAMTFYVSLFDDSKIIDIQRYQQSEAGKEGSIKMARFILNGSPFICSDSYIKHEWSFTPAVSIYVDIDTEEEIDQLFEKLSEGGQIMMPLDNYGFSDKFGFVADRFGVSWQLNLIE
ncbi:VOC family protein [Carboxylicivirga sp. RSCT41]|uniref:VOC family protein n=1 Tax=Carboxylicivirga agarovorans TaxID=3417570 RepID=UPI003D3407B3